MREKFFFIFRLIILLVIKSRKLIRDHDTCRYLHLQGRFPNPKCPILMKLTGNVIFEKTFNTHFFIAAKFHSEVKMGVKVWSEIYIWSNISETITDRKKV